MDQIDYLVILAAAFVSGAFAGFCAAVIVLGRRIAPSQSETAGAAPRMVSDTGCDAA